MKVCALFVFLILGISLHFHAFGQGLPWLSKEVITDAHDPTIIRDERGIYTLLATNNKLLIRQSSDLLNWKSAGNIISSIPSYMSGVTDIWAPHIAFRNNAYWVYYCGSSFGTNNSWIGLASSPTLNTASPDYKWTDHGEVMRSTTSDNFNCIDPELFVDAENKVWMAFGSFWSGIKMVAIDPTTGKRSTTDKTIYALWGRGGSGIEGPTIIQNNGYYYLFSSWDKCCAGTGSTYRTMAGRSKSVNSLYTDKAGALLTAGGGSQAIAGYNRYYGPGGGSMFRDGRRAYYAHHYYNGAQNGAPALQIREVIFDVNNWPVITQPYLGRRLSLEAEHAQFTNAEIVNSTQSSNAQYLAPLSGNDSKVNFHINALQSGIYSLRIRYSSPSTASSQFLKVNTNAEVEVAYPASPAVIGFPENQVVYQTVNLTEGYNILAFRKGNGAPNLDRIDLVRDAQSLIEAGSYDDGKVVTYLASGNNASVSSGNWVKYENINFNNGGYDQLNISFSGGCSGKIQTSIDGPAGSPVAGNSITAQTASANNLLGLGALYGDLKGVHNVYLSFTGTGTCAIDNFKFVNSKVTGDISSSTQVKEAMQVFPNPFIQDFEVVSPEVVRLQITNILGVPVFEGMCEGRLSISEIKEAGTYFIRFTSGNSSSVQKIVKQ